MGVTNSKTLSGAATSVGGLTKKVTQRLKKAGVKPEPKVPRIPPAMLASVLRNLATLLQIGVPLAKALSTMSQERSMKKYGSLLDSLRRAVESGDTFSSAIGGFPKTFGEVLVNQVKAGERAGILAETFGQISKQLEQTGNVRSQIIRKLSYPAVLVVAGTVSVSFLLVFVIPLFKKTYADIGLPLPLITRALLVVGDMARAYGWMVLLFLFCWPFAFRRARREPALAVRIDKAFMQLPLIGNWLRNMAVMQFIEVFGNLIESGFTVVESLKVAARVVPNRKMRKDIEELQVAVVLGEKFSRALDKYGGIFPPVVHQLIVIGEQTGNLKTVTPHIRDYLRREIDRYTHVLVGTIEPVLTISLAATIGCILLAIYLPMFDMIGAAGAH